MAKLILSLDETFLGEYPINNDRIIIGRRPACGIHLDNLAVSGEHAAIVTIGHDSFLEDLDSTNGTFVNGKAIKRHVLHHGDMIEFGKYQLRYVNEAAVRSEDFDLPMIAAAKDVTPVGKPKVQNYDQREVADSPVSAVALPTPEPVMLGRVQVLSGAGMGRELVLNKAVTTLGKPGVQVAVITKRPQGYFITHVEGQNFPVVNGVFVGGQACQLNDHDVLELAGVKMEFHLEKS